VDPIYPTTAKRKGIEIEVKVNFTIDIEGQIKDIKFAQHKKINYFKKSIRRAIKKWRFLPAKVDEKPVESQMAKVFSFSLQS
ncbi:MAG TPA: peptidase M56, partial [Colwellia sp.]|nr:peptidase M56 [Colwellia sp.]